MYRHFDIYIKKPDSSSKKIFNDNKDSLEELLENTEIVKNGFNLYALLFNIFWLLYKRLFLTAIITIIALFSVNYFSLKVGILALPYIFQYIVIIYIAFEGEYWIKDSLKRKGYRLYTTIVANNELDAEKKFIDMYIKEDLKDKVINS